MIQISAENSRATEQFEQIPEMSNEMLLKLSSMSRKEQTEAEQIVRGEIFKK